MNDFTPEDEASKQKEPTAKVHRLFKGDALTTRLAPADVETMLQEMEAYLAKDRAARQPELLAEAEALAQEGDIPSIMKLAFHYGSYDIKKYDIAAHWLEKAVALGHGDACYGLGRYYGRGKGVEPSLQRAIDLFTQGAEHGSADCAFYLYLIYRPSRNLTNKLTRIFGDKMHKDCWVGEDFHVAMKYLNQAVKAGHAEATCSLGRILLSGREMKKDMVRAASLIRKAAELGSLRANNMIKDDPSLLVRPLERKDGASKIISLRPTSGD